MADQNRLVADSPYHPILGMNIDSNGIAAQDRECMDVVNCRIFQSKVTARAGSTKLEADADPTEDILEYHRYVDPELGSLLFAFCANSIWRYVSPGVGWIDVSNTVVASKNFTQWSITSCIDDTVGATIVAAGSSYTRPNDPQSGGGDRSLLYYDRTSGTYGEFKDLDLETILPISEEDTGVAGVTGTTLIGPELGASDNLNPNYDPYFSSYVAGSVYLSTVQSGIIATSGLTEYELPVGKLSLGDSADGVDVTCYRLIPANTANIAYSDDSYIRKDGLEWQLDFLTAVHQDEAIFVSYSYGANYDFYPTYVAFFHNALIFANTYEETVYSPWRLRWTNQNDIFKTSSLDYMDVAVGDITPILELRVVETVASSLIESFLYIYKQNAIVRASYNRSYNTDPDIVAPYLDLDEAYSEGIETVRTLEVINGQQIYLGRNDIYAFNGAERSSLTLDTQTGASRIREYIFDNLDIDNLNLCFSVYDEIQKQYILFVKFLSDTTSYPTNAFALDMERGTWTRYEFPECSAALAADFTPNASIDSLAGNIEDLTGTIEDLAGNSNKLVLLAMTQNSYIQGLGDVDKVEDVLNYGYGIFPYLTTCTRQGKVNGKNEWYGPANSATQEVTFTWTGSRWENYVGPGLIAWQDTDPSDVPPETGWVYGTQPQAVIVRYAGSGEDFDSFFLTRDFVGGTLENQDRTEQVYVEGSRGSLELSYNTDYSLLPDEFNLIAEKEQSLKFKRYTYCPDVTANNIRFLVRLKEGAIFRWMQVFSIKQDLTNL